MNQFTNSLNSYHFIDSSYSANGVHEAVVSGFDSILSDGQRLSVNHFYALTLSVNPEENLIN